MEQITRENKQPKERKGRRKNLYKRYFKDVSTIESEEKISDNWTLDETLAIARCLRGKPSDNEKVKAHAVIGSLFEKCEARDCYTEIYEMFNEAKKRLVSDPNNPAKDSDFDTIMDLDGVRTQYTTTNFRIDYTTTAGASDIVQDPASDTAINVTLADGVTVIGTTVAGAGTPDFVKILGIWLEYYLQQYVAYGFTSPIQTDASGDIIPMDITISSSGSATSPGNPININNNLGSAAGLAGGYNTATSGMGVTPGHELFHQVQYGYNSVSNAVGGGFLRIYKEGTARWAEDAVNDAYNRYNKEVPDYLNNTTISHFSVANRYETVLFWKYLTEQLGTTAIEPQVGVDAIVSLWQNLVGVNNLTDSITAIDNTISALPSGVSLNDTFAKFAIANYVKDLGNPFTDPTYEYLEDEHPRVPGGQVYSHVIPLDSSTLNGLSSDYLAAGTVNNWGIHYYEFPLETSVQDITVDIAADVGFTDPFYRVIAIRGTEITEFSGSGNAYNQQIINDITDTTTALYDKVVVIIGAFAIGGDYDLTVSINEGVPSVMLAIDHSGSMSSQGKMDAAENAATLFVDLAEANGIPGLGAVGFSTTAAVLPNSSLDVLDVVKAGNVRTDIDNLNPTNMTSIGHGLEIANNEFVGDPVDATKEVMVLLSDGKENTSPMIAHVQDDIIDAGIKVYTIGLGTDWGIEPDKLEDLATDTLGDFRMTDDPAILEEFYLQILASTLGGDMDTDIAPDSDSQDEDRRMISAALPSTTGTQISSRVRNINVISSDKRLNAVLTWKGDASAVSMVLVAPDNTVISEWMATPDNGIIFRRGNNYVFISLSLPLNRNHAGLWKAYALMPEGMDAPWEIKAFLKSGLRLSTDGNQDILETGDSLDLQLEISENGIPVSGAQVRVGSDKPLTSLGNYLAADVELQGPTEIASDTLSAKERKLATMLEKEQTDPNVREMNEYSLNEMVSGAGFYDNTLYTVSTPGKYTFTFKAEGTNAMGETFTRHKTVSKIARLKTDTQSSTITSTWVDKTSNTIRLQVTPRDVYGNLLGPGYARDIAVTVRGGKTAGDLVDLNNGTYSQEITLTDVSNPFVSIQVGSHTVPVPSLVLLEDDGPSDSGSSSGGSGTSDWVKWVAILALILAIIALIL